MEQKFQGISKDRNQLSTTLMKHVVALRSKVDVVMRKSILRTGAVFPKSTLGKLQLPAPMDRN